VVRVDPGTIEQMVLNAATNARDAMPDGGVLTIEVRDTWIDEDHRARHGWGQPGHYGSIIIGDTGRGMDQQTLERAFDPFFTTKPTGLGTGLGMAMIYGLVKQQDGFVDLRSAPGRGTTLRIYFPTVFDTAQPFPNIDSSAANDFTPATVLLVEDDPAVASITTRVLEHAGYRVLLVENGNEAISCFEQHEPEISLIVTDMVMPEMGGRALHEALRERAEGVQFLFVSGYAAERAALDPDIAFLHKPWTVTDLLRTVQYLVGEHAT
jgi:CheY-like chemotaxis protein